MFHTLHQSEGGPAAQTLPPSHHTQDDSLSVLSQHACEPLDSEIERIACLLASRVWRRRQQEVRA